MWVTKQHNIVVRPTVYMGSEGKRLRPEEGFYKVIEDGVPLERAKKVQKRIEKIEKKMFYPIEVSTGYLCCAFHMEI